MRKFPFYPLVVCLFLTQSCNTFYKAQNVAYSSYRIQQTSVENNSVSNVIKPYADSVRKLMTTIIGYNEIPLERKKENNTLGFLITDAYLEMAKRKIDPNIDVAFMNLGGISLPDLPAGPVTQAKIYELMPFDNLMVLLKMKGSLLKEYLDTLAATEGVTASGISARISNKTIQQVLINDKPLDPAADYIVVHSDYVVMNTNLLKTINRTTKNYLLRDAIIDYIKWLNESGRKIMVSSPQRISYVN